MKRTLRANTSLLRLLVVVAHLAVVLAIGAQAAQAQRLLLKNEFLQRELKFDGSVWRTVRFARADGSDDLKVQSDEFHVLLRDDSELTLDQYRVSGEPVQELKNGVRRVIIRYTLRSGLTINAPTAVTLTYTLGREPYLRKTVTLEMKEGEAIDRLEVERFSVERPASRGGRGEPVFVGDAWFFGVEYPAFYSRHTDGNRPAAYSGPYDRLGNYSFIDLEGRDVDRHPRPGLIRLMHFPGYAKKQSDGSWGIISKTAVSGVGRQGETLELAFLDYLNTIRRPVRSFIHYNNWYDREGKRLTVENFVNHTFLRFKQNLDPYGVRIDAMVADDGWQNRSSTYEPHPEQFPGGMDEVAALSTALRKAGTNLGLWIALNNYNSDIDWGTANGYVEAERNKHFSRFKRYYSITHPRYNAQLRKRLADLISRAHVQYLKHDFNEMCDVGEGRGHLPTDRHGHEASVDATLELLALERQHNPDIYQNITNWIWFSPWWLMHGNNLWMLANDAGEFRDWPELSLLVMAAAYRDVHLYSAWHDPTTRPLVPVSHLMTHGIIYTTTKYSNGGDSLRDFADYVMMYYMRGLQLKEWYITPRLLTKEQWEVLGRATRWSEEHLKTLANTVIVGGNPAKGETYGYVSWNGDEGILSVRNPTPERAEITVPFDQSVWYRGVRGREFRARVVYPYQNEWPVTFRSGEPMRLTVPGYTLLVLHLRPGRAGKMAELIMPAVKARSVEKEDRWSAQVTIPNEAMQRCDLLLIAREGQPEISINGKAFQPSRTNNGRGWQIASFDLQKWRGTEIEIDIRRDPKTGNTAQIEAWLILDRPVATSPANTDPRLPYPVSHGFQRQTLRLFGDR